MQKFLDSLKGYRTYLTAGLLGIANFGAAIGWWDWHAAVVADSILAPLGLGFLRAGIGGTTNPK